MLFLGVKCLCTIDVIHFLIVVSNKINSDKKYVVELWLKSLEKGTINVFSINTKRSLFLENRIIRYVKFSHDNTYLMNDNF